MKKFVHACAILFVSCFAFAEPVTDAMARVVAQQWAVENQSAFGEMGYVEKVFGEYDADGTLLWWYVVMSNGGAVITAPDTRIEPVVTAIPLFDGSLPDNHPLRALLTRDMKSRLGILQSQNNAMPLLFSTASVSVTTNSSNNKVNEVIAKAEAKWERLASPRMLFSSTPITSGNPAVVVGLAKGFEEGGVFTHWNQGRLIFKNYNYSDGVYNLHTPNNYVAGCVATAGAALLQFFNVRGPFAKYTKTCAVTGVETSLTTKGLEYDWSILPTDLGGSASSDNDGILTDSQKDLLSRAVYDVGVCSMMQYNFNNSGESGAYAVCLITALRDNFGLSDMRYVQNPAPADFEKLIYGQNRCGIPVSLGIAGVNSAGKLIGHQVIAVGYGEDVDGTKYTRVFMGWSGNNDAWYSLPEIGLYSVVSEVGTMIGVNDETMAVYGRVTNEAGHGVAFAKVIVPKVNKVTVTDENGYWGMRIDPSNFANNWFRLPETVDICCTVDNVTTNKSTFEVGYEAQNKDKRVTFTNLVGYYFYSDLTNLTAALPDAVNFVVEATKGGVPHSWLNKYSTIVEQAYGDFEVAAVATSANGVNTVEQCYIAGLDPTVSTNKFKADITIAQNGEVSVSWNPDLNKKGALRQRVYDVVELSMNSESGKFIEDNVVSDVVCDEPFTLHTNEFGVRLFKVKVSLPSNLQ